MDASELETDVKLYKASGELLSELQAKLPLLLKSPCGQHRKWVFDDKVEEVVKLVRLMEEWPQLLDPYLAALTQELVNAFLSYCTGNPSVYLMDHGHQSQIVPLPRGVARVLCALCKVRGQKIIVRLLNNEPKYVEPLLTCFRLWGYKSSGAVSLGTKLMIWEERYIMLLWLSHLMLAPFELASISVLAATSSDDTASNINSEMPTVAQNLLALALNHLQVPSKAREAASVLIVRLAFRGDMQRIGLPLDIVTWALHQLKAESMENVDSSYQHIGLLGLLFGMTNSASDTESGSFLQDLLVDFQKMANPENSGYVLLRDQAPARKLMIKVMRAAMLHAISLSRTWSGQTSSLDVGQFLEDTIQILLDYLSDKDTPVRQAASKALGMITLKLDPDMSGEVIEAVLSCLNENMLLENTQTGQLIPITDRSDDDRAGFKKNVNAVDPLKWHGAMLTLGHLLFRRAPPLAQLHSVIEALLIGLEFEQRSNVGTSVGVGVRDAACFGIWSLARKYSTADLSSIELKSTIPADDQISSESSEQNIIQLIATRLVVCACLDPSGNLRRGSSAALQELIGRHPDTIAAGIPVVQVVDYHAVARRSRAIDEVATNVSSLDSIYHNALQSALLQWRGARATDGDSRHYAALAVGKLYSSMPPEHKSSYLQKVLSNIADLRVSNVGSNAAARHGLVLSLARMLEFDLHASSFTNSKLDIQVLGPLLTDLSSMTGSIEGRITNEIENVLEATADLISVVSTLIKQCESAKINLPSRFEHARWSMEAQQILSRCTLASDKDAVVGSAAKANVSMFESHPDSVELVRKWLDPNSQKRADFACKGRIITLGAIMESLEVDRHQLKASEFRGLRNGIVDYLCNLIHDPSQNIEVKVNAMHSIKTSLASSTTFERQELEQLALAIESGLSNYTIDQRGDIGSALRMASIEATQSFLTRDVDLPTLLPLVQSIVKLAAEKLTKVRFHAYFCLREISRNPETGLARKLFECEDGSLITLEDFSHQADVSSTAYYSALLQFLKLPAFHDQLVLGFISSVATGTEDISRAATEALITMMLARSVDDQRAVFLTILSFTSGHLQTTINREDRHAVSTMDFLTLLLEQLYLILQPAAKALPDVSNLWQIIQQIHNAAPTLPHLEALVRLYGAMLTLDELKAVAAERLSRMLLHKWPKVRSAAAATLYFHSHETSMLEIDWHATAIANKNAVIKLRCTLDISNVADHASLLCLKQCSALQQSNTRIPGERFCSAVKVGQP